MLTSQRVIAATVLTIACVVSVSADAQDPAKTTAGVELHFAVVRGGAGGLTSTPPQVVFNEPTGTEPHSWNARADSSWIRIRPQGGTGTARLTIWISPEAADTALKRQTGLVTLTRGTRQYTWQVTLSFLDRSESPGGVFEAPGSNSEVLQDHGELALAGWVVDDVGVSDVQICVDRSRRTGNGSACADPTKVFVGRATFAYGGRPDVAALFPSAPLNTRSSWSFGLTPAALPATLRGTVAFYAIATDVEGHWSLLGSKTVTIAPKLVGFRLLAPPVLALLLSVVGFVALAVAVLPIVKRIGRRAGEIPALSPPPPPRFLERSIVLGITLASLLLNSSGATHSLGYDEMYTASHFIVDTPLRETATGVMVFNNHTAYSLAAALAVRILGTAEWVLRLPAILFGACAVVAVWRLTRRLLDPRAGVLAAALLASSPFFVEWSRSARGYSGLALAMVLSTHWFFKSLRSGSGAARYAIATVLAVYIHLYGLWLFLIQLVVYLVAIWRDSRRREPPAGSTVSGDGLRHLWWAFLAVVGVVSVLYLPMVKDLFIVATLRGQSAIRPAFPQELFWSLVATRSVFVAGVVVVLALRGFWELRRTLEGAYFIALLLVPVTTMWLLVHPFDLYPRFFVYWVPFQASVMAIGAVSLASDRRLWRGNIARANGLPALATALCLLGVPVADWIRQANHPIPDAGYRTALAPVRGLTPLPTFAVGADVDMFSYYLGKPVNVVDAPQEIERLMFELPALRVVYHAMPFNSPKQQAIAALLERRCVSKASGVVSVFECTF